MMSQTHILLAAAMLAKPNARLRNTAVVIGAFIPDAAIYALFAWSKFAGIPEQKVWQELYWQEPWQTWTAAGNSIPIYVAIVILGLILARGTTVTFKLGLFATFFALAALIHIAGDLPVHVEDAHRHLWPLSDWKFISPISYWNPDHHGHWFQAFETVFGIGLCIILYRRFKNIWLLTLHTLAALSYLAVPAYFLFQLGSG